MKRQKPDPNAPEPIKLTPSPYNFNTLLAYGTAGAFFIALTTEITRYATLRGLWNDEVLSYWILKQPFFEMLRSAYGGKDGMLPLFYVLSWPLVAIFPYQETLSRWLQIIPALAAPWLMFWWIAKRLSLRVATIAVMPTVWFFSQYTNLAWHLRSYGFFLFATAATIVVLDTRAEHRNRKWIAINGAVQFFLTGSHPFGILYCFALGLARWLADLKEGHGRIERQLAFSYIPAIVGILLWTPAILAAMRLVDPIPWQPRTTLFTLQAILAPGITSLWSVAFFATVISLLCVGKPVPRSLAPLSSAYMTFVPLACISVTLMVWFYSLTKPLYLERYFSPNVWAWAVAGALVIARVDALANRYARHLSLAYAFAFAVILCLAALGRQWSSATKEGIELAHVLLQGTRDDEFVDSRYPVYTSDFNVFMERLHYNPKSLDYRAVFERADPPLDPKTSTTERRLAEGLVGLGMPQTILLDPQEAVAEAKLKGGCTFLGVKRTKASLAVLEQLQKAGFAIETQQFNIGGSLLLIDKCYVGKR